MTRQNEALPLYIDAWGENVTETTGAYISSSSECATAMAAGERRRNRITVRRGLPGELMQLQISAQNGIFPAGVERTKNRYWG
jgi:hypothetical protein